MSIFLSRDLPAICVSCNCALLYVYLLLCHNVWPHTDALYRCISQDNEKEKITKDLRNWTCSWTGLEWHFGTFLSLCSAPNTCCAAWTLNCHSAMTGLCLQSDSHFHNSLSWAHLSYCSDMIQVPTSDWSQHWLWKVREHTCDIIDGRETSQPHISNVGL